MEPLLVRCDLHETPSGIPRTLAELGASVETRRLGVGDYDLSCGVLVERKHVLDLHGSLLDGRFWRQVAQLRRTATWPLLLIEGADLRNGPLEANAIRGAWIAVAEQGVAMLRSHDSEDSAWWLIRLAERVQRRRHRYRPRYAQIPKSARDDVPTAVLSAVPGISSVTARSLLDRFGTVAGVAAGAPPDWLTVQGIGRRRCASLADALHTPPSPSELSSEGPGPST